MLLYFASLLTVTTAFPFEITPLPVFPVPDTTPVEPCGLATRVCMEGRDCASGYCSIVDGATTGCCQDTQWPIPGPQPTPPPFEPSVCPINTPLCITDIDCGFSGYCNHTVGGDNFFGCCHFGAAPSEGPSPPGQPTFLPFPASDPAPTSVPMGEVCPVSVPLCITDFDCSTGEACNHLVSNSAVFGCCRFVGPAHSVGPVDPTLVPFPFPNPIPTAAPAEVCPASVSLCLTDGDCGAGQECSHISSNSDVFGCCHFFGVPPIPSTVVPFVQPEEQRCALELSCLVDADCESIGGRCVFSFGSQFGCCTPDLQ